MFELTDKKSRKRRIFFYLYIFLALSVLLVCATYTWFSLSQTPRVSDLRLYVSANTGLELARNYDSPDDEWGQTIDYLDLISETSPLKPVTWSEKDQSFRSVTYGFDGRMTNEWRTLTDTANANRTDGEGYYVLSTLYARTDAPCKVSLSEAVELNEGKNGAGTYVIGTPVWNSEKILHDNMGFGAETAIRLGIRITPINKYDGAGYGAPVFYIYEPNCDKHISGSEGYIPTPSIDNSNTLVPESRMILQRFSDWTEAYPVQRDVTIKSFGEFISNPELFSLESGEMVKIDIYIWLEGQDTDCTNKIENARIFANLAFKTDYQGQTGMEEIPQS